MIINRQEVLNDFFLVRITKLDELMRLITDVSKNLSYFPYIINDAVTIFCYDQDNNSLLFFILNRPQEDLLNKALKKEYIINPNEIYINLGKNSIGLRDLARISIWCFTI